MTGPEFVDPISWPEFREAYGQDSPGLLRIADTFESTGLEFLSYSDLRWQGKQIAVLRISDGLHRYGIFGTKGKPVHLARFTDLGEMTPVPILLPKPGETVWDAVVRSILRDSLRG